MDELEREAIPLFMIVAIAVTLTIISMMVEAYADIKHAASIHNERLFAQCLSGEPISTGGDVIRCNVSKYQLIRR